MINSNINLLPKEFKKNFLHEQKRRLLVFVFIFLFVIEFMFAAVFFASYFLLSSQQDFVSRNLASLEENKSIQELQDIEKEIKKMNAVALLVTNNLDTQNRIYDFLLKISNVVGDGVYLRSLNINYKTGEISIFGFAKTRDDVISLEKRLKNLSFTDASSFKSPKSNILRKEEINFSFNFKIKKDDKKR